MSKFDGAGIFDICPSFLCHVTLNLAETSVVKSQSRTGLIYCKCIQKTTRKETKWMVDSYSSFFFKK